MDGRKEQVGMITLKSFLSFNDGNVFHGKFSVFMLKQAVLRMKKKNHSFVFFVKTTSLKLRG